MTTFKTLSRVTCGDIELHYLINEDQQVEWMIYPTSMRAKACLPDYQRTAVSLVQAKLFGDAYDKNFSNGMTMFNSQTARSMTFVDQSKQIDQGQKMIETRLTDFHGNLYTHRVVVATDGHSLTVQVGVKNRTDKVVRLDFLPSFTLNGISPFSGTQEAGNLQLLRMRSKWSMEGRIEQRPIESFDLEESWKASGLALVQFGQNGTMPVRRFFPLVGIHDLKNDVIWLAKVDARASWQLNVARVDDRLVLFGGLPDDDNGRWHRLLQPDEVYWTPEAYLTVAKGDMLSTSQRLLNKIALRELPVVYNEWGTTWGHPNAQLIHDSVELLSKHQIGTYVIDAGWYHSDSQDFNAGLGDWQVDQSEFPDGLALSAADIHAHGMKTGIWFEFEGLGEASQKYQDQDALVKREGWPVTTLKRRFLDLRKPAVQQYLNAQVTAKLIDAKFDYLKVDYNDSIGVGADDADSLAEGTQQIVSETLKYFKALKRQIPQLTIESCSSGGHRLTPAFIDQTDLSSFSDAHETTSIPIIAANELNIIAAEKNLIWCVLHPDDSLTTMQYHLIAAFLGRICLSGDIRKLSEAQWEVIDQGLAFYQKYAELISAGMPFRFGPEILSYRQPNGFQIAGFMNGENFHESNIALVVIHQFDHAGSSSHKINLDGQDWHIQDDYGDPTIQATIHQDTLQLDFSNRTFCAKAIVLVKDEGAERSQKPQ